MHGSAERYLKLPLKVITMTTEDPEFASGLQYFVDSFNRTNGSRHAHGSDSHPDNVQNLFAAGLEGQALSRPEDAEVNIIPGTWWHQALPACLCAPAFACSRLHGMQHAVISRPSSLFSRLASPASCKSCSLRVRRQVSAVCRLQGAAARPARAVGRRPGRDLAPMRPRPAQGLQGVPEGHCAGVLPVPVPGTATRRTCSRSCP